MRGNPPELQAKTLDAGHERFLAMVRERREAKRRRPGMRGILADINAEGALTSLRFCSIGAIRRAHAKSGTNRGCSVSPSRAARRRCENGTRLPRSILSHLHGVSVAERGEFRLIASFWREDAVARDDLVPKSPVAVWLLAALVGPIIHRIHRTVLDHIRRSTEAD